jgi:hypothetical protein
MIIQYNKLCLKLPSLILNMQYNQSTSNLIPFFRKLADDIESHALTPSQLVMAGQMFVSWEFHNNSDNNSLSEEDIKKYLFTGWYIHNGIGCKDEDESESDDESD